MAPEILAVLSALCFASNHVASRRALVQTSVTGGVMLVLASSTVVLATAAMFEESETISLGTIAIFALAGLSGSALGGWAAMTGVSRLGASTAVSLQQGMRPIVAIGLGVVVLDESVTLRHGFGVLAILAGGWTLTMIGADVDARRVGMRAALVFPVLAGSGYAVADVLGHAALDDVRRPALGAAIGAAAALMVWLVALAASPRLRASIRFGRSSSWSVLGGCMVGFALLSLFAALERGDVSVVAPLASTQPLGVFLLTLVLLRTIEKVGAREAIAAVLVVGGGTLVAT